ncbi:MAG: helix-turn-helix transcriptional regulator, partial [Dehalococcoidales bacterium]|nr:helix-turn-helix transcriptional regulator [Dehalococcoidales bacterium]
MNMDDNNQGNLGEIIRQQRVTLPLTLQQLSAMSRVSASHLGRIEKGQRFPSAPILQKIARPLGFDEDELFTLAGYLSPQSASIAEKDPEYSSGRLDPYVAR